MLACLLEGLRDDGDRACWDELVAVQRARLVGVAERVLRDKALAEDCVQELLLRLPRLVADASWPSDAHAAGWLARLATNAALHARRRERALGAVQGEAARRVAGASADRRARARLAGSVREALATLDAGRRFVLEERFLRRRSYAEIAVDLGIAEVAVRKRVERAIVELRRRLSPGARTVAGILLLVLAARLRAVETLAMPRAGLRWPAFASAAVLAGLACATWITLARPAAERAVTAADAAGLPGQLDAIRVQPAGATTSADAGDAPADAEDDDMRSTILAAAAATALAGADTTPPAVHAFAQAAQSSTVGIYTIGVYAEDPSGIAAAKATIDGRAVSLRRVWVRGTLEYWRFDAPQPAGDNALIIRLVVTDKAGNSRAQGGTLTLPRGVTTLR